MGLSAGLQVFGATALASQLKDMIDKARNVDGTSWYVVSVAIYAPIIEFSGRPAWRTAVQRLETEFDLEIDASDQLIRAFVAGDQPLEVIAQRLQDEIQNALFEMEAIDTANLFLSIAHAETLQKAMEMSDAQSVLPNKSVLRL